MDPMEETTLTLSTPTGYEEEQEEDQMWRTEEQEEEEDDDEHDVEGDDDDDMYLCEIERAWALEIKNAIEEKQDESSSSSLNNGISDNKIKPLSDMEYAIFALVTRGNVEEALRRIHAMQLFRETYGIDNSVEQGTELMERFTKEYYPDWLLNLEVCPPSAGSNGLIALDLSKKVPDLIRRVDPPGVNPATTWRNIVGYHYYSLRAVQPTLASVRAGIIWLFETDGMGWCHVDMSQEQQLHDELWSFYPWIATGIHVYNTGYVSSAFMNLIKGFASDEIFSSVQMGCQITDSLSSIDGEEERLTLRHAYLQPDPETVQQSNVRRARDLWTIRNEKERSFVL